MKQLRKFLDSHFVMDKKGWFKILLNYRSSGLIFQCESAIKKISACNKHNKHKWFENEMINFS